MSSKSILSYFKEKTVNTVSDDVNVVDCTVSNDVNIEQTVDVTSEASSSGITSSLLLAKLVSYCYLKSPTILLRILSFQNQSLGREAVLVSIGGSKHTNGCITTARKTVYFVFTV